MSEYAASAQYYDLLAGTAHAEVDQRIAAALAGLDVEAGPVIDIGAGTGLSTALIASFMPNAAIFAVEPDATMRAALMTRVCSDPDLRRRVTILPCNIQDAPLPKRISGSLLSASLVHLDPAGRARLWHLLAERLAESGRIIVEIQCAIAEDIAETEIGRAMIGEMEYISTAAAERIGEDRQRWIMTYRAMLEGEDMACDTVSYECWTASAERVLAEAGQASLIGQVKDELVILERA